MTSQTPAALARSASLLQALGPSAAPVWAALNPDDAAAIAHAMEHGAHSAEAGQAAAAALLQDVEAGMGVPVWRRLSALPAHQLAALLLDEHPQVIALTLSRIEPRAAAALVRQVPALLATDVLQRMLHMAPAHSRAVTAIERTFEDQLAALQDNPHHSQDETVARIFDALPTDRGEALLTALQKAEDGASERVRALMFTFEDLAELAPAGLQTLLARADRALLTLALKGINGPVAKVLFANMTARAGEALREDIAALGPCPRFDVENARAELVALTRTLIEAGEISRVSQQHDVELIE